MDDIIVPAELEAYQLMWNGWRSTTTGTDEIHSAANEIILLAERIKAQRATVTVKLVAQQSGS